ncbi:hypothetical protein ACHAW5_009433 [Stephanodiscus triporus]|uniref:Thioredoxin domain-containing protein n=1 Tax=Stephanodiscus triporus TaxID=2934178 RepID=A0ABD3QYT8_9STRA
MKLTTLLISLAAASPILATGGKPSLPTSRSFGVSAVSRNNPGLQRCTSTTKMGMPAIPRGGAVHESQTLGDLDSRIQSAALQDKLTIVDFTATWCGPCKMIAPIFKELSEEMGTRAQFIKVDVDDNPEAAQKYGVSAMPTFLFIKGGEVVDRLMGANEDRLRELLHFHL